MEYSRYEIVALARKQKVIYYYEFGFYQGEWLLVSKDDSFYYIYKDYFGSCSGCDFYEAEMGYTDEVNTKEAIKFAKGYLPFAIIPVSVFERLAKQGVLSEIFPLNIRTEFSEIDYETAIAEITEKVITPAPSNTE